VSPAGPLSAPPAPSPPRPAPGAEQRRPAAAAACREKIWDHAAGTIVVTEAGGVVSDGTGAPLDFGRGRFLDQDSGIIAACSPEIHARMVEAVARAAGAGGD